MSVTLLITINVIKTTYTKSICFYFSFVKKKVSNKRKRQINNVGPAILAFNPFATMSHYVSEAFIWGSQKPLIPGAKSKHLSILLVKQTSQMLLFCATLQVEVSLPNLIDY